MEPGEWRFQRTCHRQERRLPWSWIVKITIMSPGRSGYHVPYSCSNKVFAAAVRFLFSLYSGVVIGWLCSTSPHSHMVNLLLWCQNCMDQSSVFWFKARPCFNWFRIPRPHLQVSRRVSARQARIARLSYNERHGRATITSSPAMNHPYFQNTVMWIDSELEHRIYRRSSTVESETYPIDDQDEWSQI